MPIIDPPGVGSIMAIAAHPDDIEAWCAGTMAAPFRRRDGAAAARHVRRQRLRRPADRSRALAMRREEEAREAARLLGITDVVFLRYTDGEVENHSRSCATSSAGFAAGSRRSSSPSIRSNPLPPYISHRDHRTVGRATLDAIFPLARDPLAFPEQIRDGLSTHKVGAVWLFASAVADSYVDIASVFDRKVTARLAHASQTADPAALPERFRERGSARW